MRVLVAPDKFAGTLSADAAARAIAQGWTSVRPRDTVVRHPLADGGPGFLDALRPALEGRVVEVPTRDPLGRPVPAWILIVGEVAYVETAHACGLHLLSAPERDPLRASSRGVGLLVAAAIRAGAVQVVLGLGGSATNDAGAGMLAALGAAPVDASGAEVLAAGDLASCVRLRAAPNLDGVELIAATDVDNPLIGPAGASAVFGRQKGAGPHQIAVLEHAVSTFADVLQRELPRCPRELAHRSGGGAAGGLGAAILACGGRREPGFELVSRLTRLDDELATCDLAITGEGALDDQSVRGKAVAGVAAAARRRRIPCVALVGQIALSPPAASQLGLAAIRSLAEHMGSVSAAMARPADGLRTLTAELATDWPPPPSI